MSSASGRHRTELEDLRDHLEHLKETDIALEHVEKNGTGELADRAKAQRQKLGFRMDRHRDRITAHEGQAPPQEDPAEKEQHPRRQSGDAPGGSQSGAADSTDG